MFALIASILLTFICFLIGPLFRTLPNVRIIFLLITDQFINFVSHLKACLAAMIVVALKNMALQICRLPGVYRTNKIEAVSRTIIDVK
jgi:hypothetical protein